MTAIHLLRTLPYFCDSNFYLKSSRPSGKLSFMTLSQTRRGYWPCMSVSVSYNRRTTHEVTGVVALVQGIYDGQGPLNVFCSDRSRQ